MMTNWVVRKNEVPSVGVREAGMGSSLGKKSSLVVGVWRFLGQWSSEVFLQDSETITTIR